MSVQWGHLDVPLGPIVSDYALWKARQAVPYVDHRAEYEEHVRESQQRAERNRRRLLEWQVACHEPTEFENGCSITFHEDGSRTTVIRELDGTTWTNRLPVAVTDPDDLFSDLI